MGARDAGGRKPAGHSATWTVFFGYMISVTRDTDRGGMLLIKAVCMLAVLALGECRVSMLVCVDAMRGYEVTLC